MNSYDLTVAWTRRFAGTVEAGGRPGREKFSLEGECSAEYLRTKTVTIAPQTDGTYQLSFLPDVVHPGSRAAVNGLDFGTVRKVIYRGKDWGFSDEEYVAVARASVQADSPILPALLAEAKGGS